MAGLKYSSSRSVRVWLLLLLTLFLALPPTTGSLLLESLKDHISTTAQDHCKAIYLHVLTTNSTAINFYENRDFKQHHYLPYYYSIRGVLKDGFTYVLYLNGGHPPWTLLYPLLLLGFSRLSGAGAVVGQRGGLSSGPKLMVNSPEGGDQG